MCFALTRQFCSKAFLFLLQVLFWSLPDRTSAHSWFLEYWSLSLAFFVCRRGELLLGRMHETRRDSTSPFGRTRKHKHAFERNKEFRRKKIGHPNLEVEILLKDIWKKYLCCWCLRKCLLSSNLFRIFCFVCDSAHPDYCQEVLSTCRGKSSFTVVCRKQPSLWPNDHHSIPRDAQRAAT